jgi:predicted dehydrogenase
MVEMKEVRWGFIGCGDVTEIKSGPAFGKIPHSKVVAVTSRNVKKAKDYAQRHGIARFYATAGELLKDPEVNAVYVATPPAFHADYAITAARAGKHVYVEKPMAMSHGQCQRMIAEAQKSKVYLFVAYYRRALPYFLKIKEILDAQGIGEVQSVLLKLTRSVPEEIISGKHLPWRYNHQISGGGLLVDLGSHQLDLLDFLLGPIDQVMGLAYNRIKHYKVEDVVGATFRFSGGVVGSGMWNFAIPPELSHDEMEIIGSKGRLRFAAFDFTPIYLDTVKGHEVFHFDRPLHIQEDLIGTVVAHLRGQGACPSTGESAARTNRVIDQILGKYYRRK